MSDRLINKCGVLMICLIVVRSMIASITASAQVPEPSGKDMGVGFCTAHGHYKGATCPTCARLATPGHAPASNAPTPSKGDEELRDLQEASADANDKGVEWYEQRKWDAAIAYFREALDLDPDNEDARYNLNRAEEQKSKELASAAAREAERASQAKQEADRAIKFAEQRIELIKKDQAGYSSQLQKIMREVDESKGPPPPPTRQTKFEVGLMLGLFDPHHQAADKYSKAANPFTDKAIEPSAIFATTNNADRSELIRGVTLPTNGGHADYIR